MKKLFLLTVILMFIANSNTAVSQDTFSIVAVDPVTGEVGSAGASCVAGSIILSDVHPGVGVIHTQASYLAANQNYARSLMNLGLSPSQIRDSVVAHDSQNNPSVRQYGIVDLVNGGRTAAYTGVNCLNYKNHILGPYYSIQGNILLGQQILDSMQTRFLNTQGSLATRLMAALQGAKVIGADTRCTGRNTSSISAFLRVGRPQDTLGTLYLSLNVNNTPVNKDPIDSLQVLFNNFLTGIRNISTEIPSDIFLAQNYPNPFNPDTNLKFGIPNTGFVSLKIYDMLGKEVATLVNESLNPGNYEISWNADALPSGIYYYTLVMSSPGEAGSSNSLNTGGNTVTKRMVLMK
ncbi:MAG TPA: DUF1028 domain-containing protein [Ignavibacteria bacterium]|nr:DUF1028 domain-containing protein [Ignavibacteria bacterium]